ncbi:MAG TPA: DUF1036 domain-containing protein [Hyphomonadaceae bacterium]|nr:DUF1036 domain-containing protein [Hyphomonadaceae bacterium]
MARERWSVRGMWTRPVWALAAIAAVLLGLAVPSSAQGGSDGWKLCNRTSFILEAATGRPEGQSVIVQGWTRIRPGECRVALEAPLKPGVYFVFARSSKAHRGGQRIWNGEIQLCVDPNGSFSVESPSSCAAMGLEQRGFKAVRIDKRNGGSMTFHESDDYNLAGQSPENAGIQRLLDDAGIESDLVDGVLGREAKTAIAGFLAERKLPANTSTADLIDILEDVARNRALEVGLMLCNRTDKKITAAIARKKPDGWESRGWWVMEAGACVRTVDESLIGVPHYVYAEMETPQGERYLAGADTPFCTATRSRFAILGPENCDKRRWQQSTFVETAAPEDGKLVYEFFDRAFGPPQRPKQP